MKSSNLIRQTFYILSLWIGKLFFIQNSRFLKLKGACMSWRHIWKTAHFSEHQKQSFSGGMIRRIGIAQTLLNSPMILLLDEPTAGLDPQERIRLRNILSSLSEHSIVVLSTHIVSDVELIADKVILLNNGTLLAADRVNDLLHNLKGMVWSFCLSSKAELQEMSDECLIGNVIQNDCDIQVRVVSRNKPNKNAVSLPPTMEDLYLFYFQGGDTH